MAKISSKSKEIINKIQTALNINMLSKDESEGQLNNKSLFKFFRGSALMVPFSIGRTIRGVRFTKQALDPFSSCLENKICINLMLIFLQKIYMIFAIQKPVFWFEIL